MIDAQVTTDRSWSSTGGAVAPELSGEPEGAAVMPAEGVSSIDRQQLERRFGMASGLFFALQAKHAPTAVHAWRVARLCCGWGLARQMPESMLATLEMAALMHDIGHLGIPERLLETADTGQLRVLGDRARQVTGLRLLQGAGFPESLVRVVAQIGAGRTESEPPASSGEQLEWWLARMVEVVDAFDGLLNRNPGSAVAEQPEVVEDLLNLTAEYLDATLMHDFMQLLQSGLDAGLAKVDQRWRQPESAIPLQGGGMAWSQLQLPPAALTLVGEFAEQLLDHVTEGLVLLDEHGSVVYWNQSAEQLTGVAASSLLQKRWSPQSAHLCTNWGEPITEDNCPLWGTLRSGRKESLGLRLIDGDKRQLELDVNLLPLHGGSGKPHGAAMIFRDATHVRSLEEQVDSLAVRATCDSLTKVANRAELTLKLPQFTQEYQATGRPASLIICDIDFFKKINDVHGHQAGDAALVCFAAVLKKMTRQSDFVARYGGEEFVILVPDCEAEQAADKAEEIRLELSLHPMEMLGDKCISASFGVAELRPDDDHITFLERADQALLLAKQQGRNRVVLAAGDSGVKSPLKPSAARRSRLSWLPWLRPEPLPSLLECQLMTAVPMNLAIAKLRGFVTDHRGRLKKVENDQVVLQISTQHIKQTRQAAMRSFDLLLEVNFSETDLKSPIGGVNVVTVMYLCVRPVGRRKPDLKQLKQQSELLRLGFQSYMVAHPVDSHLRSLMVKPMVKPRAQR
jgi:diguanylate cyclase (GGDEF)-like protein/PAS domain S-box-containing protein